MLWAELGSVWGRLGRALYKNKLAINPTADVMFLRIVGEICNTDDLLLRTPLKICIFPKARHSLGRLQASFRKIP